MTRSITCYVVFITLIWGAHTDDEEKVRDMFKSNMTRNDFSNLLQSLIKLNEQRVSVLQKLYRLEDYGVLSEVLRSGDKKIENGNPNNLFLIFMSKNQNNPPRRKNGFQLVDSVSSLNAGSNNNHPKLDFVLDPAGYFTQNIRKENRLESIFGNFPRVGPTKKHRPDNGNKKISTTNETLKFNKPGLRTKVKHDSNVSRAATSVKTNEDRKYHKENSRYEIVNNKERRPNANENLLGYDDNRKHPQTVGYKSQSNEYAEIDFTVENEKLATKPNIIKHIITSNHQNPKHSSRGKDEDDYENGQNRQYTKLFSDISIKKYHDINQDNPKTNKYTPKINVQSNQQKDKLTIKPIIIKDILSRNDKNTKYPLEGSPFEADHNRQYYYTKIISDIANKKHHDKTNKYTPTLNRKKEKIKNKEMRIQRNQHPKLNQNKSNLNNQGSKNFKIKAVKTTNRNNDYRVNSTVKKTSENNQVIKNLDLNHDNTNANNDGLIYSSIKDEYATNDTKLSSLASENVNGRTPVIPKVTEDMQYGSYSDFEDHKYVKDNSNKAMPVTVKDTLYENYPDFEDHKDLRDNSNKHKLVTVKDTLAGNYPDFEDHKDVRDNSNKDKPKTAKDTPFEKKNHGFQHHKHVMKNLNKDKPNKLHHRDNPNVKSKKDTDYYGVKMFDNSKSGEEFSVFITNVGNRTAEEVKQQNDPQLTLNTFDKPRSKHIARQPFAKCLNKKALKLCCKSCISAYKNVCRRLKCTSRAKKALKSECKRSCKKTFASSSSKYSDENSDESDSDYS